MGSFRTQVDSAEPSVHAHYLYDATGQRVKKLVRKQGGQVEVTHYIDGVFEHHRWGSGPDAAENNSLHIMDDRQRIALVRVGSAHPKDKGPAVQVYLGDHLGSSNVVVDSTGELVNCEEFTPYGETSFGSFAKKRYRFTGKERDEESGLNYHEAGYYVPWLARWASCDPALAACVLPLRIPDKDRSGRPILAYNLYLYCLDNPLLYSDSNGRDPISHAIHTGHQLIGAYEVSQSDDALSTTLYITSMFLDTVPASYVSFLAHGLEGWAEARERHRIRVEEYRANLEVRLEHYIAQTIKEHAVKTGATALEYNIDEERRIRDLSDEIRRTFDTSHTLTSDDPFGKEMLSSIFMQRVEQPFDDIYKDLYAHAGGGEPVFADFSAQDVSEIGRIFEELHSELQKGRKVEPMGPKLPQSEPPAAFIEVRGLESLRPASQLGPSVCGEIEISTIPK
jgi:RHS repeat-associated protein